MNSLEKRLQLALSMILLIASLGAGWLIYSAAITMGESTIKTRLEHDGEALLAAMVFDEHGVATIREERLSAIYQSPFSGHYFHIVVDGKQQLRSRSTWDQPFDTQAAHFSNSVAHMRGPNRQQLLLWSAQYNKQGHHITLTTAEDLTPLYLQLRHYGGYLLISIPLFLLLVLAIQRLILRHAFKPLDLIQQEIQQLERGEIEQLHTPLPAEITPLVDEVNRLILAMVTRIKRSRNSAGNLAHTLKSPLQLLVQLAESNQLADHGTIRQQLLDQVGQIQQQIEHELTRARLAGNATPGQQFRPADELPALRQMLLQIYHDRGLNLMLHYPEAATVALDRDDMLELTGNLLDNACKWARTAVHCRIELNGRLTITIEDDGPGCAPELLQQLTKRGIRVDETTTGHGLGLAIVNEIVASYQGTIEFSSSPKLGGFKVTVTLPLQG